MSLKELVDVQAEMKVIQARLAEIAELDEPDGDEVARSKALEERNTETDDLISRWDVLKEKEGPLIERSRRLDDVRQYALDAARTESGDGSRYLGGSGPAFNKKVDPYEERELEVIRSGHFEKGKVIERARRAVDQAPRHLDDKGRAHVEKLLTTFGDEEDGRQAPLIARHLLLTGSPEYHNQFREYMRTGFPGELLRANMSLTDSAGGYLVPFTLDPTIILTNAGIIDPLRQISTVKQTATDTASYVTSAGVTAGWTAEAAEATDGNVSVGLVTITPKRADAWVAGTYEVLADSGFASQLGRLVADAKARVEGAAFATGNTGATQPRGIVAAVAAVTTSLVSAAATNALAIGDVYNTQDEMSARYQGSMSWLANKRIYSKIRQFDTSGGGGFWTNLGAGIPNQLLGANAYQASTMESAITTGGLVLLAGDFAEYYIVDRIGMTMQYNPMVMGRTNSRPTGEAGWFAFWRVGADVADVGAFRLLQLNSTRADVPLA
jgi:HK97 family phage major capsid protein